MKNIIIIAVIIALIAVVVFVALPRYNSYLYDQLMEQAEKDYKSSKYEEAKNGYNRLLEINPGSTEVIGRLGTISFVNRDYDKAVEYFNEALKKDPDNASFTFDIAQAYYKQGKIDKADEYYRKTLKLDKNHANVARRIAVIMWERGEKKEALAMLKEAALTHTPDVDPPTYNRLGEFSLAMKQDQEAKAYLEKLMTIKKPPKESMNMLLKIYAKEKDREKIDRLYEKMLSAYSDDINTYIQVSSFYENAGKDNAKAESILLLAKDNLRNKIEPHIALSEYFKRCKQYDKGLKILEEALAIEPNSNKIYFMMGLINYDEGSYAKTETELQRALSIKSDDPSTLNMMAWLYLTAPENTGLYNPKEALKLSRRAISYQPGSPAIVDTLARAYFATGKYDESILRYKENLSAGNTKEYAHYGIALCNYKLGNEKQAKEHLKKAINLGFKDEKLLAHDKDIPLIKDNEILQAILKSSKLR